MFFFFFQAEDGIRDADVTGVQTCALPISLTGSNGVFRGSFAIAPELAQLGDGVIGVSSGDLLTVTYAGSSPAVQVAATARINVQTPTITDVHAVALGATQAVVS